MQLGKRQIAHLANQGHHFFDLGVGHGQRYGVGRPPGRFPDAILVRMRLNFLPVWPSLPDPPVERAPQLIRSRLIRWPQALLLAFAVWTGPATGNGLIQVGGVVWQPHGLNLHPDGDWHRLGAYQLLVQWRVVDGLPIDIPGPGQGDRTEHADWQRIGQAPWAREVILGLAGRFQETEARAQAVELAAMSASIAKPPPGMNVVGWYFPVEFDPTWEVPGDLVTALAQLPRPLWVSLYDNANVGTAGLVSYLQRWLPADVGVFWQDGVGVHARDAVVAQEMAVGLAKHLGNSRLKVIAEAFRPAPGGGFRPATVTELREQLTRYTAFDVFLFEGPTYVPAASVAGLLAPPTRPSEPQGTTHWVGDQ